MNKLSASKIENGPRYGYYVAAASIISGIASSRASSKAAEQNAASQAEAANKSAAAGGAFVDSQLGALDEYADLARGAIDEFSGSFVRTPNATEFFDDAAELDLKGFDFQTNLKRANLDFIAGDSQNNLRSAQGDFAALAAGDFSAFKNELNASLNAANAESFGSPVGTTFNIAARDRFNFRTAGLNESLKISDFFAREGTIDPPDPVRTAFDLSLFEQSENKRKQDFDLSLLEATLKTEAGIFNSGFEIGKVGLAAETNSLAALGQLGGIGAAGTANTLGAISKGLGSAYGLIQQRQNAEAAEALATRQTEALESLANGY